MGIEMVMNSKRLGGGRDRTRTCDLLRVKNVVWLGNHSPLFSVACMDANSGRLSDVCALKNVVDQAISASGIASWRRAVRRWYTTISGD